MRGVVGTIRIPTYWMHCEPRPGEYDFEALDRVVGRAADAGIRVLPFVYGSPAWVAAEPASPPLAKEDRASWARFLRVLVRRYGPGGTFWEGRARKRPIRRWQLWNEPNFPVFWAPRPSPAGYARLLATGARAVRGEDRRARIVLAGLAPIE
jgi:Beta-galactosidase